MQFILPIFKILAPIRRAYPTRLSDAPIRRAYPTRLSDAPIRVVLFYLFFNPLLVFSQNSLFEILNTTEISLTGDEQNKFSKIQENSLFSSTWLIKVIPIQNVLENHTLLLSFPNEIQPVYFETDFPTSKPNGDYTWLGYNIDGSSLRLTQINSEVSGFGFNAKTGNSYRINGISKDKSTISLYDKTKTKEVIDCNTEIAEDDKDDEDDSVDDRGDCGTNLIRVLFVYTLKDANNIPSTTTVASEIIELSNTACYASGLTQTDVHFVSAGVVLMPDFFTGSSIIDDVKHMRRSNSGVHELREQYYADIVMLLTGTGHIDAVGVSDGAFCVSEMESAISELTATHEFGHTLGARHQRCETCNVEGCNRFTDHHGFLVGDNQRTIMAQGKGSCCGVRERVGRFSNPFVPLMGQITGDYRNNNVHKIYKRAGKVSCYMPDPPSSSTFGVFPNFLISISGLNQVCNTQGYYPFQSIITGGDNAILPLTYLWEISPTGYGNWTQVSTSSSYVLMNPNTFSSDWITIRLTITDAVNNIATSFKEIKRVNCVGTGSGDRAGKNFESIVEKSKSQINVAPNPGYDLISINGINSESMITILDIQGKSIYSKLVKENTDLSLSILSIPSGFYTI
jgi:hypothetical protein